MSEYKEYYIQKGEYNGELFLKDPFYSTVITPEELLTKKFVSDKDKSTLTHVIEYAALEQAQQEIKELNADIKRIESDYINQIEILKSKLYTAKKLLDAKENKDGLHFSV